MGKILNFYLAQKKTFIKYALVGLVATLVELVVLYYLKRILLWRLISSSTLAFTVSFCISFVWRKYWAFRDYDHQKLWTQSVLYLFIFAIMILLNTCIVISLVRHFHFYFILAQFLAGTIVGLVGYWFNRDITFKKIIDYKHKLLQRPEVLED